MIVRILRKKISSSTRPYRRVISFKRFTRRANLNQLPNLITLGNAFFGFSSMVFAAHGNFAAASYFILLGALMDALDGRVARYVGVTSELGLQLDSLSDAISFCMAPAFLTYFWVLRKVGFIGYLACAFFLLAGIARLAKFNITSQEQVTSFGGMPTTLAGCFLVTVLLNSQTALLQPSFIFFILALVIFLGLLMISPIRFPSFKKMSKNWYALSSLLCAAFVISMGFLKVLLLLFLAYFVFTFIQAFVTIVRK
ncbi:CDP-diacylglycerol--serine O-phosphatidyltransferase [Candidatus Babeliales bacterium]|nr:CDP-diacylglycerol--serine O-phosphatidyltransferase [Candidatus Babeliales bacterium]